MSSTSAWRSAGLTTALLLALALAFAALPATAQETPTPGPTETPTPEPTEEPTEEEEEEEEGPLEIEVRPKIAAPGRSVLVQASYELDDEDESEEEEEESDPAAQSEHRGRPIAVTFEIDFGDGSGPQPMILTEQDIEDGEGEAVKQHLYAEAGAYTVTVTATPEGGTPVTGTVDISVGSGAARLDGDDRFETANELARESFPDDGEASAVLLARADAFADALTAATLAVAEDAPVLLTQTATLPDSVLAEIARALGEGGTVYLLGGEEAIDPSVAVALTDLGYEVVRIAGEDRIETAIQVVQFLLDAGIEIDEVVLASALNFPDALAGAAYAASEDVPVLLTGPDALDPRVAALLAELGDVEVLVTGGPAAISDAVIAELLALGLEVERIEGEDRYETAAELAEQRFADATVVIIATGANFPDALAGAAHAGRLDGPVLLVGGTLPEAVRDYLADGIGRIEIVYVIGGEQAVPAGVLAEVQALLGLAVSG